MNERLASRTFISACVFVCLAGCTVRTTGLHLTWSVRGAAYERVNVPPQENPVRANEYPVAGIVSHHLLAGAYIDDWFRTLRSIRNVDTFIIVSPRHHGIGSEPVSVGNGTWATDNGTVATDERVAERICRTLGVNAEPLVFDYEHGVSVLVPFIESYFPHARIAAIALPGEPPVDTHRAAALRDAILPVLGASQNTDQSDPHALGKYFLVISTDFAHHGTNEQTNERDTVSRRFLSGPSTDTWNFALCDNRPGMFVLASLAERTRNAAMRVLHHTNSFAISGFGKDDITSYFFAVLCGFE